MSGADRGPVLPSSRVFEPSYLPRRMRRMPTACSRRRSDARGAKRRPTLPRLGGARHADAGGCKRAVDHAQLAGRSASSSVRRALISRLSARPPIAPRARAAQQSAAGFAWPDASGWSFSGGRRDAQVLAPRRRRGATDSIPTRAPHPVRRRGVAALPGGGSTRGDRASPTARPGSGEPSALKLGRHARASTAPQRLSRAGAEARRPNRPAAPRVAR